MRKSKNYPFLFYEQLIVFLLVLAGILLQLSGFWNLPVYHMIGLVELGLLYGFYHRQIRFSLPMHTTFGLVFIGYIVNSLFFETVFLRNNFNTFGRSGACFFLLFLGIYYLYVVYKEEKEITLYKSTVFWINAGLMFYFGSSFFTYLLSSSILSQEISNLFSMAWLLIPLATFVKNIIISLAIGFTREDTGTGGDMAAVSSYENI
ncbi:MAG: hypothetical protein OEX02_08770 [Cyclobacteriaceae bacterium]|nr:hypothetical protein [Cyclobacteriaceae bacterium]